MDPFEVERVRILAEEKAAEEEKKKEEEKKEEKRKEEERKKKEEEEKEEIARLAAIAERKRMEEKEEEEREKKKKAEEIARLAAIAENKRIEEEKAEERKRLEEIAREEKERNAKEAISLAIEEDKKEKKKERALAAGKKKEKKEKKKKKIVKKETIREKKKDETEVSSERGDIFHERGEETGSGVADRAAALEAIKTGKAKMIARSIDSLPKLAFRPASPRKRPEVVIIETDDILVSNAELKRRRKEGERSQKKQLEKIDLERLRGSDRLLLTANTAVSKDVEKNLLDCGLATPSSIFLVKLFPSENYLLIFDLSLLIADDHANSVSEEGEIPRKILIPSEFADLFRPMIEDMRVMRDRERMMEDRLRIQTANFEIKEKQIRGEYEEKLRKVEKDAEYYRGKAAALSTENAILRGGPQMSMKAGSSSGHQDRRSADIVVIPMEQVDREMSRIHRAAMVANHSLASAWTAVNEMQDVAAFVGRKREQRK